MRVAVLGLGEAGQAFATGLAAAGASVVGHDPRPGAGAGVARAGSNAAAAAGADLVLSLNASGVAETVAAEALPAMRAGAVLADLNTAPPQQKRRLDARARDHGVRFADVAVLGPVPPRGVATPSLAAGPGAAEYARIVNAHGGAVDVVDGPAGAAAARKLLRSVVMKGLAAALLEALAGARAAGCEDWLRDNLADQFGAPLVTRLETGSHQHAARRVAEMDAAVALLADLGVEAPVSLAARHWLDDLARP
jgi:3-hydroxyisobutyrate dehydrogenase-like beta-hydroxyacid dehydrogenase